MKNIIRLYEEDLRQMVIEKFDVRPSQVISIHTEEVVGYGMGERTEPVFYIEVEKNEQKEK